ncbi:MAG: AI-2E family transporter [Alphaproteobacteria bacterium]|nr:AI-2E family transporter [Alphaproteobacteria bacterium]
MTWARAGWIWLAILVALIAALYLVREILLPFVVGLLVAYLLSPTVDRLQGMGMPRWLGTTLVGGGFVVVVTAALFLVVPLLVEQTVSLVERLPEIATGVKNRVLQLSDAIRDRLEPEQAAGLEAFVEKQLGNLATWLAAIAGNILGSGIALFNALSLVFITPVVGFYMLRDWHHIIATVQANMPAAHEAEIDQLARRIDRRLSGFVRGQAVVCVSLGVIYAVALSIAGLEFGLAIGIFAGFVSFVPYVGSLSGLVLSTAVAIFQFPDWTSVAVIVAIFLAGQALEGNVLTPLLVGDRVGLHPVWVIFALLAGGAVFGFLGLLLAVPAAAVLGVLVRYVLERYRVSELYSGPQPAGTTEPDKPAA